MLDNVLCPYCQWYGKPEEVQTGKKRLVTQSCPRCGNDIRTIYKPKKKAKPEGRK